MDGTELSQNNKWKNNNRVASDSERLSPLCCRDKRVEAVQESAAVWTLCTARLLHIHFNLLPKAVLLPPEAHVRKLFIPVTICQLAYIYDLCMQSLCTKVSELKVEKNT